MRCVGFGSPSRSPDSRSIATIHAERTPCRSSSRRAAAVVPPGEVTFSRSSAGCSPDSRSIATIASRALNVVFPASSAYAAAARSDDSHSGVSRCSRPSRPMTVRTGSCSSRHHIPSVRSPNVQHLAMPAPLSISAAGCGSTGISTPKTGESTVEPNSGW